MMCLCILFLPVSGNAEQDVVPEQGETILTESSNKTVSSSHDPGQSAIRYESAAEKNKDASNAEVVWEWDPYYTNVGINIPLTNKPIPTITSDSETVIYRNLIKDSAIPRYMTIEASVNPMPVAGTYLKTHAPGFYSQGQIGHGGINIFDSITAGFQEPWAISIFFGNIAKLERPGEKRTGTNIGYTGYLFSTGKKHIKSNTLVDDDWYELEWKIKGKLDYMDEKMSWSFRFGGKFHANLDITDVFYFSIHRSNLDHHAPFLHWLKNSSIDLKVHFSQHGGQVVREEIIFGKKYPIEGKSYSATLNFGFVWESPDEYIGVLKDRNRSSWTLVARPSLEF